MATPERRISGNNARRVEEWIFRLGEMLRESKEELDRVIEQGPDPVRLTAFISRQAIKIADTRFILEETSRE